jgi:NAD-dependent dihydropyrimidine dehydrogenase PreA subunit
VKIDKNDKVIIEAYSILGLGKEHAKFQAVSNVFYRFYPQIDFDDSKCSKCPDKCLVSRMCPQNLFEFTNKKTPELVKDYWQRCTLCESCQNDCLEKAINLSYKDNAHIFSIESDGVLPYDVIIKKTFEIFLEKIDEFVEKLEAIDLES